MQMLNLLFYVALAASFAHCHSTPGTKAPTVALRNGTYQGYHLPKQGQDVFLGMPYAQPPIGDLRFREPQPLNTTWAHVKPATEYGHIVS